MNNLEVVQQWLSRNSTTTQTLVHTSILSTKKHVEKLLQGHKVRIELGAN